MSATTPVLAFPVPTATDPVDIPSDMEALALRVEAMLAGPLAPLAKGRVGYGECTTNVTGVSTATQVPGCEVTFVAEPGREYLLSGSLYVDVVGGTTAPAVLIRDAANVTVQYAIGPSLAVGLNVTCRIEVPLVPVAPGQPAASKTYRLWLVRQSGTGTLNTNRATGRPDFLRAADLGLAGAGGAI